jgi:NADPH-dependent curcumin reductase CurA
LPVAGLGQMLLRTLYILLDPYMRGRMSDAPTYAAAISIGAVMEGGTVAQVVTSDLGGFGVGDWVLCANGWQDYAVSDGSGVRALATDLARRS